MKLCKSCLGFLCMLAGLITLWLASMIGSDIKLWQIEVSYIVFIVGLVKIGVGFGLLVRGLLCEEEDLG